MFNRRQFLQAGAVGLLGNAALSELFAAEAPKGPGLPGLPHFQPRAKRVIYLTMEGGPSQLDTFDHKPGLLKLAGQDLPPSVRGMQRLTGMSANQSRLPIGPSPFKFEHHANNQDGIWLPEFLRHTGSVAKDLCVIRTLNTEQINHGPAVTYMQTGFQFPGRPSMGAWLSYGLGSVNRDLPGFVVLISQGGGQMQALFTHFWGSGFLPSQHQGVQLRAGKEPVLFLNDPEGLERGDRRAQLDLIGGLNRLSREKFHDAETEARIAQAEMAFRMQSSVPELADLSKEPKHVLDLYGPDVTKPGTFAYNCLMARRLAERDVRFIQLYHRGWDQHGNINGELPRQCRDVDQGQAALITDLKQRGLLDDTLVIWGGEFGRTSYCQGGYNDKRIGRDHHPRCFSVWVAGGGFKPGIVHGSTDEFSYNIAEGGVSVNDFHATLLHQLGVDHVRLSQKVQGLDMRLTGVAGKVRQELLS
ncbi:MAG: hypothetical protein RL095_1397 [Verrucomicrobiota bacterium]|jgi:hypothetical protein